MISRIAMLAVFAIAAALPAAAQERPPLPPKLFASAAEVEQLLAKAKAEHKGDNTNTNEIIVTDGPYPVQLEYRTGTTPPSIHKGQAELIYVVDGGCTLIQGGTLIGQKPGSGPTFSGTGIEGGTPRKIAKGDYIMVPPDTPHWYTDVQGTFVSMTIHVPLEAK
ncbi:MAG TPA: hypothetical protein VHZ32_15530 [Rhizomicrobium sp.]|jgi:hypothetical protein|nr:hypothetical protein [Rhizomicrobium sp.]